MVADPVEGLGAQVEWPKRHVGTPRGVIEALLEERRERVLARVPAGSVAAVVADGHRLDERDVQAECRGDRPSDLGHLECVRHPVALMVAGEHEDLGLAGQAPECRIVEDPVPVTLEAGSVRVGDLVDGTVAGAGCLRGVRCQHGCVALFARLAGHDLGVADRGPRIGVREHDLVVGVPCHRRGPAVGPFLGVVRVRQFVHRRSG